LRRKESLSQALAPRWRGSVTRAKRDAKTEKSKREYSSAYDYAGGNGMLDILVID